MPLHLLLLAALCSGCVHADRVALASSTAALACDWSSTRSAASDDWMYMRERNQLLGPTPSTRNVDEYFAAVAALNVALWAVTPAKWRSIGGFTMTAVETKQAYHNAPTTGVCGF